VAELDQDGADRAALLLLNLERLVDLGPADAAHLDENPAQLAPFELGGWAAFSCQP
jgi:hypothetical protein